MNEISGIIVAPIWRAFMDVALTTFPKGEFNKPPRTPDDIKPILRGIWFDPGALVLQDEDDTENMPTLSLENTIATAHDILYYVTKNDPRGPVPENPESDPQFSLWEYPVSVWKSELLNATTSTSTRKKTKKDNDT
jgi:membrane carboxypeptidase/penicillin-binding protein